MSAVIDHIQPEIQPRSGRDPSDSLRIAVIDPSNPVHQWDSIVDSLGAGTFFHTSSWARTLTDTYQFAPCYFVAFQGETPVAAIPLMEINSQFTGRRGVSLPFSDTCPLLTKSVSALTDTLN